MNLDEDGNVELVDTVFCRHCHVKIKDALVEMAELFVKLHIELVPGANGTVVISGTREIPLPLNTANRALMNDIVHEITSIADRIRAERYDRILKPSETPGRTQREGRWLSRSIDFLVKNLNWALEKHDDGSDTGKRILNLNHQVRSALKYVRYIRQYDIPCPADGCGLVALTQASGTGSVRCRACGAHWPDNHIHRLAELIAYEQQLIS